MGGFKDQNKFRDKMYSWIEIFNVTKVKIYRLNANWIKNSQMGFLVQPNKLILNLCENTKGQEAMTTLKNKKAWQDLFYKIAKLIIKKIKWSPSSTDIRINLLTENMLIIKRIWYISRDHKREPQNRPDVYINIWYMTEVKCSTVRKDGF